MSTDEDLEAETDALQRRLATHGDIVDGTLTWLGKVVGGAAGVLAGSAIGDSIVGGVVGATASATFESGVGAVTALRRKLDEQAAADAMSSLGPRTDEIRQNVAALRLATDGRAGNAADVSAILQMFVDAWTRAADHRARQLIENAAVNAFDPKRYEEGLTRTLFAILSRLEYGDIEALRTGPSRNRRESSEIAPMVRHRRSQYPGRRFAWATATISMASSTIYGKRRRTYFRNG